MGKGRAEGVSVVRGVRIPGVTICSSGIKSSAFWISSEKAADFDVTISELSE